MKPLVVLSLFDGMSGAQMALKKAGIPIQTYYSSEIDKFAIQVTQSNFPDTIQLGSVIDITKDQFGEIDLLIGGSPCTDLSIARSNRQSLDGDKSRLFFEFLRILKEVQPKYFLLENVASMSVEARRTISELVGVEPVLINSRYFSFQKRKRLYWTNIPINKLPNEFQEFDNGLIEQLDSKQSEEMSVDLKNLKSEALKEYCQQRAMLRVISALGIIAWSRSTRYPADKPKYVEDRVSFDGANTCTTGSGCGSFSSKNYVYQNNYLRPLTVLECKRLQTVPDEYKMNVSKNQAYKMLGNGFTVDVIAHILRGMV